MSLFGAEGMRQSSIPPSPSNIELQLEFNLSLQKMAFTKGAKGRLVPLLRKVSNFSFTGR